MRIAVLALQGDFAEHEKMLGRLGAEYTELRRKEDLGRPFDGIILPGGESTVQGRLLSDLEMYDGLKELIINGLPVLATCAGLILLAEKIEGESSCHLGTLPVTVRRNAYGRQLGSFHTADTVRGIGTVPMSFIRAPFVTFAAPETEIISVVDGNIVGVRYKNQLALAFHPELDDDTRIFESFLEMIRQRS